MTPRERVLAALRGQETDRIPLTVYSDLLPDEEIRKLLGDHLTHVYWSSVHTVDYSRTRLRSEDFVQDGEQRLRQFIETPVGMICRDYHFDPAYHSQWAIDSYIKKPGDWDVLRFMFEDATYKENYDWFLERKAEYGHNAVQMAAVGRTPFQCLAYEYAGVERLSLDYYDHHEKLESLLALMAERQNELDGIYAQSPAEVISFPDNITAVVLGRERFHRYCVPRYDHMADVSADTGKIVIAHMDGYLRPMMDLIAACGLTDIEAFTPAPDGDVSVAEARKSWTGKQVWINYPSSVHLRQPDEIYRETRKILEEASPTTGFLIGVTENVPENCWRRSMAAIDRAMEDFQSETR